MNVHLLLIVFTILSLLLDILKAGTKSYKVACFKYLATFYGFKYKFGTPLIF